MSARKVRRVLDLVRGEPVPAALVVLGGTPNVAAHEVAKVTRSAAANAQNNHAMGADELWICEAYVDQGPTLRRLRRASFGRGRLIRKRSCHITVVVGDAAEAVLGQVVTGPRAGRRAG